MASGVVLLRIRPDELEKFGRLRGKLSRANQVIIDTATDELRDYGKLLKETMRGEAPVKFGVLRESVRYAVRQAGTKNVTLEVAAGNARRPEVVVKTILFGSRPHVIVPKRARVLAFPGSGGKMVFASRVNHPGTNPNNFMERAWWKTGGERVQMVQRIGRVSVEKILR
jgi:hypothetical protein